MKKLLIAIVCMNIAGQINAQSSQAEELAAKLADRMKDSLVLTLEHRNALFNTNLWLHQQKQTARDTYSGSDSLGLQVQRIENKRDSLYQAILPQDKFLLYELKKRNLINNN